MIQERKFWGFPTRPKCLSPVHTRDLKDPRIPQDKFAGKKRKREETETEIIHNSAVEAVPPESLTTKPLLKLMATLAPLGGPGGHLQFWLTFNNPDN